MPLQKIKRGSRFCVLTGMWVFQHITLRRDPNSWKPQVKIRFAFHFVERNYCSLKGDPSSTSHLRGRKFLLKTGLLSIRISRLFHIMKSSTSDNAILASWLVHWISVTSHYTCVWLYMEMNAINVARHKLFFVDRPSEGSFYFNNRARINYKGVSNVASGGKCARSEFHRSCAQVSKKKKFRFYFFLQLSIFRTPFLEIP